MLMDETKTLVNGLFRSGLTNNEDLKVLICNLQKILELSSEESGAQNEKVERESQIHFLSELADLYRPTNASKLPTRLLGFEQSIREMHSRVVELVVNFPSRIPGLMHEQSNAVLVTQFSMEVVERTRFITEDTQKIIDDWLAEIRY